MSDAVKCDCDKKIDEMLKEHNTRLSRAIVFGATSDLGLMLKTEQIETGRGKKKAVTMFPTYCPFCGSEY